MIIILENEGWSIEQSYYLVNMQLRQIQSEIDRCRELIQDIEEERAKNDWDREQATWLKARIRAQRIQITHLHYQLKHNKSKNVHKKQFHRMVNNLQTQITNTIKLNTKIYQQYKQITTTCNNYRKKIEAMQRRQQKAKKQTDLYQKYCQQGEILRHMDKRYWQLRTELQSILISTKEQKQERQRMKKDKEAKLMHLVDTITKIDEQYIRMDQNVRIQNQLIKDVLQEQSKQKVEELDASYIQLPHSVYVKELKPSEIKQISRIQNQNIEEEKKEMSRMGKIIKQTKKVQQQGQLINLSRSKINYSDMTKKGKNSYTQPAYSPSKSYHFSNSRLKKLQNNKRIRTRQSQMHRFSQQYKNLANNESMSIDRKPQKPILQIYEQMKRQVRPLSKKVVKNIQIIKYLKSSDRKRKQQSQRENVLNEE